MDIEHCLLKPIVHVNKQYCYLNQFKIKISKNEQTSVHVPLVMPTIMTVCVCVCACVEVVSSHP